MSEDELHEPVTPEYAAEMRDRTVRQPMRVRRPYRFMYYVHLLMPTLLVLLAGITGYLFLWILAGVSLLTSVVGMVATRQVIRARHPRAKLHWLVWDESV